MMKKSKKDQTVVVAPATEKEDQPAELASPRQLHAVAGRARDAELEAIDALVAQHLLAADRQARDWAQRAEHLTEMLFSSRGQVNPAATLSLIERLAKLSSRRIRDLAVLVRTLRPERAMVEIVAVGDDVRVGASVGRGTGSGGSNRNGR